MLRQGITGASNRWKYYLKLTACIAALGAIGLPVYRAQPDQITDFFKYKAAWVGHWITQGTQSDPEMTIWYEGKGYLTPISVIANDPYYIRRADELEGDAILGGIIGTILGGMADVWVADDAFYGLIRDREVLTEILREVGGDTVAQAHATEKGKTIKGVIDDFLTGENGRAKHDHWVPRWMAFPPSAYTERGGVATVAAANRVRWQAEAEEPTDPAPQAPALLPEPGNDAEEAAEVQGESQPERLAA